ncbi:hypothetical protein OAB79_01645 [Yoonia sp.]|nr:hypothetical protein [Yoonia sp.]
MIAPPQQSKGLTTFVESADAEGSFDSVDVIFTDTCHRKPATRK